MERLLSLVVIRTVHLSDLTSIEYATADSVPAIVPLALPSGIGTPCPFQPQKGEGIRSHTGERIPPKKAKKRGLPRFPAWLSFLSIKRSIRLLLALARLPPLARF